LTIQKISLLFFFILAALLLSSCQAEAHSPASIFAAPETALTVTQGSSRPAEPVPTSTAVPTATPRPTPTPTATPVICQQSSGRVERFSDVADAGGQNSAELPPLPFRIYLPPCYGDLPDLRYPVLYIFHGQSFNDDQWDRMGIDETADALIASKQAPPFLIVMPLEADTWANPFDTWYGLTVTDQLIPWIDTHYQTCPERACRAVGGLSRGGAWAIHVGFRRWSLFGSIGAHSTPVFIGDPDRLPGWLQEIPPDQLPRLYMDIGHRDWFRDLASEFEGLLLRLNIPHEWYVFQGTHDEEYWSAHMQDYLLWYSRPWLESLNSNTINSQ
jgi:enterochelin esterase-like enzyme